MNRSLLALAVALAVVSCDARPSFDKADIDAHAPLKGAPKGFLLGTATAPHQVEGGLDDDWTEWERGSFPDGRPHIVDRQPAGRAADSWNRWPDDVALLEQLGANAYRVGLDWSRLVPAEGAWDDAAAARYRELLASLRAKGITPMVTLHHFTLPRWFVAKGGWVGWDGAPRALADFAAKAAQTFGDQVDLWCTINEPNVLAVNSYVNGVWPPGEKSAKKGAEVQRELLKAHALMAKELRAKDRTDADGDGKATSIGFAHHVRVFEPASWSPLDGLVTGFTEAFFNDAFPLAIRTGRIVIEVPGTISIDEPFEGLAGSVDWLGLNYYTRDFVRADVTLEALSRQYVPGERPKNDLHWDVYPEGFYRLLVRFGRFGWPILVTENGMADDDGTRRPDYLRAHLFALDRARADGVDVRAYFHWSLIDNFEWAEGYTAKFGLFTIDFAGDATLARRPTPAVAVFQEAARNAGLTPAD